jgi:hypothetical protein
MDAVGGHMARQTLQEKLSSACWQLQLCCTTDSEMAGASLIKRWQLRHFNEALNNEIAYLRTLATGDVRGMKLRAILRRHHAAIVFDGLTVKTLQAATTSQAEKITHAAALQANNLIQNELVYVLTPCR